MDVSPVLVPDSPEKALVRNAVDAAQPEGKIAKADAVDGEELCIHDEILLTMYDLDVAAMATLLLGDSCKQLTTEQKLKLYEAASQHAEIMREFASHGAQLAAHASDLHIKQRLSHYDDLIAIKKIKAQLSVFKYFKNIRFPQVLFSPRPYHQGPRQTLDTVLKAFIAGEQESISSSCFHLTLFDVARKLLAKRNEGVAIELVTNQSQGDDVPLQALEVLTKNGIHVYCPRFNRYEMNHHKFFVFKRNILDKPLVWMGSYNPTGSANENSWDDVMIVDDNEVVQNYLDRFSEIKLASQLITSDELKKTQSIPSERSLTHNNVPPELWQRASYID